MPKIALNKTEFIYKVIFPLRTGKFISNEKTNEYISCLYTNKETYLAMCLAMDFDLGTQWDEEKKVMMIDTEMLMKYVSLKKQKFKSIW